jgi:hypothetical protein
MDFIDPAAGRVKAAEQMYGAEPSQHSFDRELELAHYSPERMRLVEQR